MNLDYQFFAYTKEFDQLLPQAFEVFTYPMGDTSVKCLDDRKVYGGAQVMWVSSSAPDWSLVYAWSNFVRNFDRRVLVLPYLPSARGDKDTTHPAIINARLAAGSGITDIVTLDPHSRVWMQSFTAACGHTIKVHELNLPAVVRSAVPFELHLDGIIAPDAGAQNRAGAVAEAFGLPLLTASKHRDPATGHLSGYIAPADAKEGGSYLVVDDICDGGGTFNLLAEGMPDGAELHLWVSHGGFTKGVQTLVNNYTTIFTTDSLRSAGEASVGYGAVVVRPLMGDVTRVIRNAL